MATARIPAATVLAAADGWREATLSAEAGRRAKLLDKVMAQTKRVGPFWARRTVPRFESREEAWGVLEEGGYEWHLRKCVNETISAANRLLATARAAMSGDGYVELNDDEVTWLGLGKARAA